jgi:flagellar hook-length control protein FliK
MQLLRPSAQEPQDFAQTLASLSDRTERDRTPEGPRTEPESDDSGLAEEPTEVHRPAGDSAQGVKPVDQDVAELNNDGSLAQRNAAELAQHTPLQQVSESDSAPPYEPEASGENNRQRVGRPQVSERLVGAESQLPRESGPTRGTDVSASHGPSTAAAFGGDVNQAETSAALAAKVGGAVSAGALPVQVQHAGSGPVGAAGGAIGSVGAVGANTGMKQDAGGVARPMLANAQTNFREVMSRLGTKPGSPFVMRTEEATAAQAARIVAQGLRDGKSEVVLRLRPETLGPVKIELSMNEGALSARIEAATPAARELLDASMDQLRAALEARGLVVQEMNVAHIAGSHESGFSDGGAWSEDLARDRGGSGGEHQTGDGRQQQHWGDEAESRSPGSASQIDIERGDLGIIRIDAVI